MTSQSIEHPPLRESKCVEAKHLGPEAKGASPRRVITTWVAGFLGAILVTWGVTAVWVSPKLPYIYNAEVKRYVVAPGVYRSWEEGDGVSRFGKYGVSGHEDIRAIPGRQVMIWGDSYVQAMQVDEEEKMAWVVSREWADRHPADPLTAIAVGNAGWNIADIYFQMPLYENLCSRVEGHYIVLGMVDDLEPWDGAREAKLVYEPSAPERFAFVESSWVPRSEAVKQKLSHLGLHVVWSLLKRSLDTSIRFGPGVATGPGETPAQTKDKPYRTEDAIRFVLRALVARTNHPVTLVYLPKIPAPLKDGAVALEDVEQAKAEKLAGVCAELGVRFINLGPDFVRFHEEHKRFPRGFANTVPWSGHLNVDGQRLVAEAIVRDLEARER